MKVQLRESIDIKKTLDMINFVQKDQILEDQEKSITSAQRQDEIPERKRQLCFELTAAEADTKESGGVDNETQADL